MGAGEDAVLSHWRFEAALWKIGSLVENELTALISMTMWRVSSALLARFSGKTGMPRLCPRRHSPVERRLALGYSISTPSSIGPLY